MGGAPSRAEEVRIVHAGGRIDEYFGPGVSAAEIMLSSSHDCGGTPEVCHCPSTVWAPAEVALMRGNRFFIVPFHAVFHLVRRQGCNGMSTTSTTPYIVRRSNSGVSSEPRQSAESSGFSGEQKLASGTIDSSLDPLAACHHDALDGSSALRMPIVNKTSSKIRQALEHQHAAPGPLKHSGPRAHSEQKENVAVRETILQPKSSTKWHRELGFRRKMETNNTCTITHCIPKNLNRALHQLSDDAERARTSAADDRGRGPSTCTESVRKRSIEDDAVTEATSQRRLKLADHLDDERRDVLRGLQQHQNTTHGRSADTEENTTRRCTWAGIVPSCSSEEAAAVVASSPSQRLPALCVARLTKVPRGERNAYVVPRNVKLQEERNPSSSAITVTRSCDTRIKNTATSTACSASGSLSLRGGHPIKIAYNHFFEKGRVENEREQPESGGRVERLKLAAGSSDWISCTWSCNEATRRSSSQVRRPRVDLSSYLVEDQRAKDVRRCKRALQQLQDNGKVDTRKSEMARNRITNDWITESNCSAAAEGVDLSPYVVEDQAKDVRRCKRALQQLQDNGKLDARKAEMAQHRITNDWITESNRNTAAEGDFDLSSYLVEDQAVVQHCKRALQPLQDNGKLDTRKSEMVQNRIANDWITESNCNAAAEGVDLSSYLVEDEVKDTQRCKRAYLQQLLQDNGKLDTRKSEMVQNRITNDWITESNCNAAAEGVDQSSYLVEDQVKDVQRCKRALQQLQDNGKLDTRRSEMAHNRIANDWITESNNAAAEVDVAVGNNAAWQKEQQYYNTLEFKGDDRSEAVSLAYNEVMDSNNSLVPEHQMIFQHLHQLCTGSISISDILSTEQLTRINEAAKLAPRSSSSSSSSSHKRGHCSTSTDPIVDKHQDLDRKRTSILLKMLQTGKAQLGNTSSTSTKAMRFTYNNNNNNSTTTTKRAMNNKRREEEEEEEAASGATADLTDSVRQSKLPSSDLQTFKLRRPKLAEFFNASTGMMLTPRRRDQTTTTITTARKNSTITNTTSTGGIITASLKEICSHHSDLIGENFQVNLQAVSSNNNNNNSNNNNSYNNNKNNYYNNNQNHNNHGLKTSALTEVDLRLGSSDSQMRSFPSRFVPADAAMARYRRRSSRRSRRHRGPWQPHLATLNECSP